MDEELARRSMIQASPMMGGGCAGAGEVGEKEDKPLWSWVKMNQLIFFPAFNIHTNFLNFSRMRYYIFLNSILIIILQINANFFSIFISKFHKFLKF
jgi:hypothetical protein